MTDKCPICAEGTTHPIFFTHVAEYLGCRQLVPAKMQECDYCGSEFAGIEEMSYNHAQVTAFHREVESRLRLEDREPK